MASVTLLGVYLAPVADLTTQLHLNAGVELSDAPHSRVEARSYSAGRVRMITRPGQDRSLTVSVRRIDRATREQLEAWTGVLLLLRDGRGRKVYGFYATPAFAEQPGEPISAASLTFVQITHDESV